MIAIANPIVLDRSVASNSRFGYSTLLAYPVDLGPELLGEGLNSSREIYEAGHVSPSSTIASVLLSRLKQVRLFRAPAQPKRSELSCHYALRHSKRIGADGASAGPNARVAFVRDPAASENSSLRAKSYPSGSARGLLTAGLFSEKV